MVKGFKKNNVKGLKQKILKAKKLKLRKLKAKEKKEEQEQLGKDRKTSPKTKLSKPFKKILYIVIQQTQYKIKNRRKSQTT